MISLARASGLYVFANIVPRIGALLLVPIYVRLLTSAEYGLLALAATVVGLLSAVYHLGLDAALMRLHFDGEATARGRLYSTITLFTLGFAGAATLAAIVLGLLLVRDAIFGMTFAPIGTLTLLIAFTGAVGFVPSVFFRATGQPVKFLIFNVGGFALTSSLVVSLVAFAKLGVIGSLLGQLIAGSLVMAYAVTVGIRASGITFDRGRLREALAFGVPLVPHAVSGWALRLMDRWLIGLFIGLPASQTLAAVGTYSLGYQVASVVTILLTSFNSAWSPYFYRIGQSAIAFRIHREMTTVVIAGLAVVAVSVSALAPEVVQIIARPGYEGAADVIPVVALGALFQALYTMCVTVVFLSKRTGSLPILTASSALLNLALNVLLIPPFGIVGAAWATAGGYGFFAFATFLYAVRRNPIRVDFRRLLLIAFIGGVTFFLARQVQPSDLGLAVIVHLSMSMGFAGAVAILLMAPLGRLRRMTREAA